MPGVGKFCLHRGQRAIESVSNLLVAYAGLSAAAIEMCLPAKDGCSMGESIFFANDGSWS